MKRALAAALAVAAMLTAVPAAGAAPVKTLHGERGFNAVIRETSYGIPHILARDWGDAAYGYGYAFARENICTMADTYATVRGERSRYFGPDASYVFEGNGVTVNNLNSD